MTRFDTRTRENQSRRPRAKATKIRPSGFFQAPKAKVMEADRFPVLDRPVIKKPKRQARKQKINQQVRVQVPCEFVELVGRIMFDWYVATDDHRSRVDAGLPVPESPEHLIQMVASGYRIEAVSRTRAVASSAMRSLGYSLAAIAEAFSGNPRRHSTYQAASETSFWGKCDLVRKVVEAIEEEQR